MAGKIDVTTPIVDLSAYKSTAPDAKTSKEFSKVLDSLKSIVESTASGDAKDNSAKSAVKETVLKLFEDGADSAKDTFESLTDDQKAEVIAFIQKLLFTANTENSGGESGSTQDLLNSLFATDDDSSDNVEEALDVLQDTISKLDDGTSIDMSAILSQLVSSLAAVSTSDDSTSTDDNSIVEPVDGSVSVIDGNSTYTMSLEDSIETLQNLLDQLNGIAVEKDVTTTSPVQTGTTVPAGTTIPADTTTPVIPSTPTDTAAPVNTEIETPVIPTTPTTQTDPASTADSGLNQTGQLDASVTSTPLTARAYTYTTITAQNSGAADKLMSEGSVAKTSVFSQRVNQKAGELETLTLDLSNAASLTTQNVLQTPSAETAQSLSEVPVETQIMDNITTQLSTLEKGKTSEMTMTLNPEKLGQITVKLENDSGKITVTIAAQSEITQKLLQDKLPSLITNLQNVNADVKDVRIVEANQNASFLGFNLNNSNAGQSGSDSGSNSQAPSYSTSTVQQAEEIVPDNSTTEYKGGSKLWQTA